METPNNHYISDTQNNMPIILYHKRVFISISANKTANVKIPINETSTLKTELYDCNHRVVTLEAAVHKYEVILW